MSGEALTNSRKLFTAGINQELEFFPPAVIEGSCVVKPLKDVFEEGILDWKHALVGQFIGSAPNFSSIKKIVMLLWGKASSIKGLGFRKRGLSYIASVVGKPLHMDSITAARERLEYARLCVEVPAGSSIQDHIDVVLSDESVAKIRVSVWRVKGPVKDAKQDVPSVSGEATGDVDCVIATTTSEALEGISFGIENPVQVTIQNDQVKVVDAIVKNNYAANSVPDRNCLANNLAVIVDVVKQAEQQSNPLIKRGRGRLAKEGRVAGRGSRNKFEILNAIDPDSLLEISDVDSGKKQRGASLGVAKLVQDLKLKKKEHVEKAKRIEEETAPLVLHLIKALLLRFVLGELDFFITVVYGSNDNTTRRQLWTQLSSMEASMGNMAWLIGSDFNTIVKAEESSAQVNYGTLADISEFQSCVEGLGLFDHPYIASDVEFQAPGDCDHYPALVWLHKEVFAIKSKPFKFFNFWAMHPDFISIVKESWQTPVNAIPIQSLYLKLKRLKRCLKELNRNYYNDISGQVRVKREKLKSLQLANLDPSIAGRNINAELETEREIKALEEAEMMFYKKKAKVDWIKDGDQGTQFFHSMVAKKRKINTIRVLFNQSGERLDTFEDIPNELIEFFVNQLGVVDPEVKGYNVSTIKDLLSYSLPRDTADTLCKDVSDVEIKEVLWGQRNNKSPYPDGYNVFFFKRAWSVVGEDFLAAIRYCFDHYFMLPSFNATTVMLVPKIPNPSLVKDFRLISCCSVVYKTVTRILVNILSSIFLGMISMNQTAFLKGRSIVDNTLLAQELVRGYSRKKISPRCALKIDLQKAFDSLNWEFIDVILHALGLPDKFIG
ncbi:uncharacterized protein LOC120114653 [Hibiscus syriacus]|uniref:uncharacterized protein LOC120114653 n=1 Tax=Hibiscus syriacus TaxID=106335 RepID=UPI0019228E2B|nr:uncharacterized protein LOC120114653 [Hibiscus syriacus]